MAFSDDRESSPLSRHLQLLFDEATENRERKVRRVDKKAATDLFIASGLLVLHFEAKLSWREIADLIPHLGGGGHAHKVAYRAVTISEARSAEVVLGIRGLLKLRGVQPTRFPVLPPLVLEGAYYGAV